MAPNSLEEISAKVSSLELLVSVGSGDFSASEIPQKMPPPASDFSPNSIWIDAQPVGIYDEVLAIRSGFRRGPPKPISQEESNSRRDQYRGTSEHYMSHCQDTGYLRVDEDLPIFLPGRDLFADRLCSVTRAEGEDPATHLLLAGAWMVNATIAVRVLAAEEHLVAFHRPGSANGNVMQMPGHRFANYAAENQFRVFLFLDGIIWEGHRTFIEPDYYRQHVEGVGADDAAIA